MNYNLLRKKIIDAGFSIEEISDQVNVSRSGMYNMLNKETLRVDVLEKICAALDIPTASWFLENESNNIITEPKSNDMPTVQNNGQISEREFAEILSLWREEVTFLRGQISYFQELLKKYECCEDYKSKAG